jgi:hypothetical protein
MAATVEPALRLLVEALRSAGLNTSTDPRDVQPPCALVVARSIKPKTSTRAAVAFEVLLIAPGIGNGDALAWLDEALAAVWGALPLRWPAELVSTVSPTTGLQMLAYSLTHTADIELE